MPTHHRLVVKKYVFDNNIEYLDTASEHSERRFKESLGAALAVAHFYKKYPDKDFMEKDVVTVLSRMSSRNMYICELKTYRPSTNRSQTDLVAAAMLSEFYIPIRIECNIKIVRFYEAGGMRSILGGFNIQKLMHAIRMLDRMIIEPKGYYFAATYADSIKSQYNLEKFLVDISDRVFPELAEYRLFELEKKDERDRGVRWFRA